ncbi:hypothetical protein TWF481_002148 [Arthrobotrys musiformis]|uniref:F-box domain-containing protein n=1 Tax=Arthrobotrys musiformis TaxID=47236 RepID=A0AAV9VSH8_9PEZI
MASLNTLPVELVREIGKYVDEDGLLALRLACKDMNSKMRVLHLDAKFKIRRVFFDPIGLENLLKISQHPSQVNERVRHLIFTASSPYCITNRYESPQTTNTDESEGSELDEAPPLGKIDTIFVQAAVAKNIHDLSERYNEWERSNLLALAFSNLPKVQSITFENVRKNTYLTRSELNLFFPSVGLKPGIPVLEDLTQIRMYGELPWGRFHIVEMVLSALLVSGLTSLESLTEEGRCCNRSLRIPLTYFIRPHPHRLSQLMTVFGGLKVLKLCTSFNSRIRSTDDHDTGHFTLWLEAVCGGVEILDLGLFAPCTRILNPPMLPLLKVVAFTKFGFRREDFEAFLLNCKDTLVDLKISGCVIDGRWQDWFYLLRLLQQNVKGLGRFELNNLDGTWTIGDGLEDPDLLASFEDWKDWAGEYSPHLLFESLIITGSWGQTSTTCSIEKIKNMNAVDYHLVIESIETKLEAHNDSNSFWESLVDEQGILSPSATDSSVD